MLSLIWSFPLPTAKTLLTFTLHTRSAELSPIFLVTFAKILVEQVVNDMANCWMRPRERIRVHLATNVSLSMQIYQWDWNPEVSIYKKGNKPARCAADRFNANVALRTFRSLWPNVTLYLALRRIFFYLLIYTYFTTISFVLTVKLDEISGTFIHGQFMTLNLTNSYCGM